MGENTGEGEKYIASKGDVHRTTATLLLPGQPKIDEEAKAELKKADEAARAAYLRAQAKAEKKAVEETINDLLEKVKGGKKQ